jgi:hypothetical protein
MSVLRDDVCQGTDSTLLLDIDKRFNVRHGRSPKDHDHQDGGASCWVFLSFLVREA